MVAATKSRVPEVRHPERRVYHPSVKRIGWLWPGLLCACGRIDFDPVGPTLWLQMEETSPGSDNIVDSGGGHAVRCVNMCPTSTDGAHGHGFQFDGGQQLQIDWSRDLDGSMGYTVAAWARLGETPRDYACTFAEPNTTDSDGNSYALCIDKSRVPYVYATPGGMQPTLLGLTGRPVEVRDWHHLAATWDGIQRTRALYVDGARVNSEVGTASIRFSQAVLLVGTDLKLDGGAGTAVYPWHGALDDIMFFPRALQDAEIAELATR